MRHGFKTGSASDFIAEADLLPVRLLPLPVFATMKKWAEQASRKCKMRYLTHVKTSLLMLACSALLNGSPALADYVACSLTGYKAQAGLSVIASIDGPVVTWNGDAGQQVRMAFAVDAGKPVVRELAISRGGNAWTQLGRNLSPEFSVMTGLRRMSNQQLSPLRGLGVPITQAVVDQYRWDPFWDAPFDMSEPTGAGNPPPAEGLPGTDQPGLPRQAAEIQRADAIYAVKSCTIKTDGARMEISFPGVKLGLFDGALKFTVFKGTNLVRQEIVASTKTNWVAYKYDAGLKGLAIHPGSSVLWHDLSNNWQQYALGGKPNADRVALKAYNRLVIAEQGKAGSIAVFPPPHKFFWSREVAINMGYNWYRKDSENSYAIGIRQNEHEDDSEGQANWALYSARPGTEQLMTVFLYPSLLPGKVTQQQVMTFTHGDRYKPLPGYQVMQHHYHMDLGSRLLALNNMSTLLPDLQAIKALGINIVSQIDSVMLRGFSDTGAAVAPAPQAAAAGGAGRGAAPAAAGRGGAARPDQIAITAASVEGARISSDKGFLVLADQEVFGSPLGGHTDLLFSHPVYWDQRQPGQPFKETNAKYGTIYHVGDAADFMNMVKAEDVLISMPHPRTKGSTGFPDAVKDRDYFNDPHYQGFGLRWGMGLDGSERRTCEYRCLPLIDDMANWVVDRPEPLKYAIAISEVRHQQPGDDLYAGSPVTYVRLKDLPPATNPRPVIDALMKGDMFITTGEVLVPKFSIEGKGDKRTIVADVEWTFPLDMVEIVWGDGQKTGRQVISVTDLPPFGKHHFVIPFDARGKKWVRFAVWDSAYEGAILEPQRLGPTPVK